MSFPQIIEVAIGLALVYYILGLIVSLISSRILESLETRGQALEKYLKQIVGDRRVGDLLALPQIKSLKPVRYDRWWGAISGKVKEAKRIETVPVSNLVDAFFDLNRLVQKKYKAGELKTIVGNLPDSEGKKALLKLIDQGVTDIDQLRAKTAMWFNGLMDQAAATYKANARRIVIGLALLVTLLIGVDSIDFAGQLYQSADLRAVADAKAKAYIGTNAQADIGPLLKDLGDLGLRVGWWAVPANLPQKAGTTDWVVWSVKKILGLLITFVAVAQGSSFWYDILRKLKGETVSAKSESESTESQPAT